MKLLGCLLLAVSAFAAKQPIHGLVAMGSLGFNGKPGVLPGNLMEEINAHPGIYTAAVISLQWSQLEPQRGIFDDSALTSALATIATYNAKYPATPVSAKLRIFAGLGTPAWLPAVTGGPVNLPTDAGIVTLGTFWSAPYRTEWQALQAHLAANYDASPLIAEVAISSCASTSAEPFIVPLDAASRAITRPLGYSDSAMMACLAGAKDDYAAWTQTPLDYTFNEFRNSDSCTATSNGNCLVANFAFSIQVMDAFRAALGTRAVIANHGLQSPLAAGALPIYSEFLKLGGPVEFQTISQTVSWDATIQLALTYHPTEIEIWDTQAAGGLAPLSTAQLQNYAAQLNGAPQLFSAASLKPGSVAPASLVSIFGTAFPNAPVTITDSAGTTQAAAALYTSATQVNVVLPASLASGAATFSIGPNITGALTVSPVAPALFSADATGTGLAAAQLVIQRADGSVTASNVSATPINLQTPGDTVYLVLFGTGFRNRTALTNTSVTIGKQSLNPIYAGPQNGFAGLDQLNVVLPPILAGAGAATVFITVDRMTSNALQIQIQ